jgi:hypothetical protein
MIPVELILLAIEAGVKLYTGLREAYAASIKEAAITLPLPRAPVEASLATCADFIEEAAPPRDPQVEAFEQQKALVLPLCQDIGDRP